MGQVILPKHIFRAASYLKSDGLGPFILRSLAGSGAVRIGAIAATFIVGVLLARGLGVESYGYYSIAIAVIGIAGLPAELGLPRLVTREVASSAAQDDASGIFGVLRWADRVSITISVLIAIVVGAFGAVWAQTHSESIGLAIIIGAPAIPLVALTKVRGGGLQGLHHVLLGQIPWVLVRPIVQGILLVTLMIASARIDANAAMALYVVGAAAAFFFAHLWLRTRLPKSVPARLVRGGRRWIMSTIPMALAEGMRVLQSDLSILIVGAITTPVVVGLYRIASVTSTVAAVAIAIANHVAFPVIARLYAERDRDRLQKAVTGLAWAQFCGVAVVAMPLVLVPDLLVRLVYGGEFVPSANALRVMAIGQTVSAAFGTNAALLNMTHHEGRVTRAMGIALVLNLVLLPPLGYLWGVTGAAIGFVLSLVTWNMLTWIDGRRFLGVDTSILMPPPISWRRR